MNLLNIVVDSIKSLSKLTQKEIDSLQKHPEIISVEVQNELEKIRHENKLNEIEAKRKLAILKHQQIQENHRIKNAEARKREQQKYNNEIAVLDHRNDLITKSREKRY